MSVANLTKLYVHINKFGVAAARVVSSKDLCDPSLKYEVLVKFEEAVDASSNNLQQLKAEIAALVAKCNTAHYIGDDEEFDSCIKAMRQLSAV